MPPVRLKSQHEPRPDVSYNTDMNTLFHLQCEGKPQPTQVLWHLLPGPHRHAYNVPIRKNLFPALSRDVGSAHSECESNVSLGWDHPVCMLL